MTGRSLYADVRAAFGAYDEAFEISGVKLVGDGTAGGSLYYDGTLSPRGRRDHRGRGFAAGLDEWHTVGPLDDRVSGSKAIRITPASTDPDCAVASAARVGSSAIPSSSGPGARSAAARSRSRSTVTDTRDLSTGDLTYFAGPIAPAGASHAIQVAAAIPDDWTTVRRNLLADAQQILGFYNNSDTSGDQTPSASPPPSPDPVKWTG